MADARVYTSEDRSVVLPYYKRWLIEPFLPFIPARVHPNAITHLGHVLCLAGALLVLAVPRSSTFLAMAILLQAYVWCDNADGAHARRTKQSSAYGEFLDHGLDLLNTVYIGVMTVCTLGASPAWTVAMVTLIPAAAAITAWEQAETGVYKLGFLNQIESCAMITLTGFVSAFAGTAFWSEHSLGPVSLRLFLLAWPAVTITFGVVRALLRVHAAGSPLGAALVFLGLNASVIAGASLGYVPPLVGATFATAVNLHFGVRMLVFRLAGKQPRAEKLLSASALGAAFWLAWRVAGWGLPSIVLPALAIILAFAGESVLEARRGVRILANLETAPG